MKQSLPLFAVAFLIGAFVALAGRAVLHRPYANAAFNVESKAPEPMVHNAAAATEAPAETKVLEPAAAQATTNTICPVCGMPVDPSLPTTNYEGKVVGFGCRTCPPKFAAEPELYGPAALSNQTAE